ncbi:MAG: 3'-5' exonuclease, partial [Desulfomonilia bacterium]
LALLELRQWQHLVKGCPARAGEMEDQASPAAARRLREADALLTSLSGSVLERVERIEGSGLFRLPKLEADHVFYRYARIFGEDVDGFVRYLRLSSDQDALAQEKVRVLTTHAAKGLEFKCVFIPGLSRGAFPLQGCPEDEERNLFYVAMTRAVDLLYLLCPNGNPSPFISRIPPECCIVREERKMKKTQQMLLFDD